jgi:scyllo-inositol 2-dehydrogenase (NAD+)
MPRLTKGPPEVRHRHAEWTSSRDGSRQTRLKLILIGAGRMGRNHAQALRRAVRAVELVGVVDPNVGAAGVATTLARQGAPVFRTLDAALDALTADACLVASPTVTHAEIVSLAIEHGLHVLCEKPLTLDPAVDIRLGRLASEHAVRLQVGFWRRFSDLWRRCRRTLKAGSIGEVLYIRASQLDAVPPHPSFCDPRISGGLIVDCGVHEFDMIEWLSQSRIQRVATRQLAVVNPLVRETGDCDNVLVSCDLESGAHATIHLTRNVAYADDIRTDVFGSAGAVFVAQYPKGSIAVGTASGYRSHVLSSRAVLSNALVAQLQQFAGQSRQIAEAAGAIESARALVVARAATESMRRGGKAVSCRQ